MGLRILRPSLPRRFDLRANLRFRGRSHRAAEMSTQLFDDRLSQLALHREHILQVARVAVGPELLSRGCAAQASGDAHTPAGLANAPFDQVSHTELLADLLRGCVRPLE